ncbi:MAG: ATP-binding protein, partial [Chlorobiales bacterium]|nr:ATP-binding protein [Chlorobiales bacterium]
GYHALFRTMDDLIQTIRFKELTTAAGREYKRLLSAHLLVIDDIMMFPLEKTVAVGLFQLVNQLHEQTSFIITTNKSPKEWAEMLGDEVLATALLDRLLYKCEVIKLTGKSYRLENRRSIFDQKQPAEGGAKLKKTQLLLQ